MRRACGRRSLAIGRSREGGASVSRPSKLILRSLAAAGVLAVLIGAGSLASASGGREDATFRLLAARTSTVAVDVGQPGTSGGDEFIYGWRLRNIRNTRTLGDANDVCTVLSSTGVSMHCVSTITLRAGTIELAGDVTSRATFTVAITGGTGAYDQARGQLVASPGPNARVVFALDIDR